MKPKYRLDNQDYEVTPIERGTPKIVDVNGIEVTVSAQSRSVNKQTFTINGRNYEAHVVQSGDDIFVQLDGEQWHIQAINPIDAAGGSNVGSDVVIAPMPGTVVSLNVKVGQEIAEGETLLTIESMKLQTTIVAEKDGQIADVYFYDGDTFDKGAELLRFQSQLEENSN
jgi:biotin carboxyl carrier protein